MIPYHEFYVGQQVACVDDTRPFDQIFELKKGEVYTIRHVGVYNSYLAGEYLGVWLAGITRGPCPFTNDEDPPYRASRFRPLVKDRLASLRQAAVDPQGPVQGDIDGPRKRVKEEERV